MAPRGGHSDARPERVNRQKRAMKKIMFNDRYGLTQAVIDGRKTVTRRMFTMTLHEQSEDGEFHKVELERIS